jgi:hypothetical protein
MKNTNQIAGWPLNSWLSFVSAILFGWLLVTRYEKSNAISWPLFTAFILTIATAVIRGRRSRGA